MCAWVMFYGFMQCHLQGCSIPSCHPLQLVMMWSGSCLLWAAVLCGLPASQVALKPQSGSCSWTW